MYTETKYLVSVYFHILVSGSKLVATLEKLFAKCALVVTENFDRYYGC